MTEQEITNALACHVPDRSVAYCLDLWRNNPFSLVLTKTRHTKAGDFSVKQQASRITINRDLNPFQFLITYIHEVAHLRVHKKINCLVQPHGAAWKTEFKQLLEPLLTPEVFPLHVLTCLITHMRKPRASTCSDARLTHALRQFDQAGVTGIALDELSEGSIFRLRGRQFKKGKLRRTRVYCHEIATNRNFLVGYNVLVEPGDTQNR